MNMLISQAERTKGINKVVCPSVNGLSSEQLEWKTNTHNKKINKKIVQ